MSSHGPINHPDLPALVSLQPVRPARESLSLRRQTASHWPQMCTHTPCVSSFPLHIKADLSVHVFVQASETFQGVAKLEATDSLYSLDCIMLTCTLETGSAPADSADTWRAVTLRISSSYPHEPPSVVVRMSQDAQLAPQVSAVHIQ